MAGTEKFKHDSETVTRLRSSIRKARPHHIRRPAEPTAPEVAGERVSEPMARLTYLTQIIVEGRTKAIEDLAKNMHDANMRVRITDQALGRAIPRAD
jgi:hypothetical protein